jgi:hypothetical protein
MAKKFDFKRIGLRVAGVAAGAVVGKIADKPLASMNPKIRSIIKIGVGAVLPEIAPKSAFVENMGSGVLAVGAGDLYDSMVNKTSTVTGIGNDFDMALGATEDYEVTGIGEDENALSGIEGDETYE